MAKHTISKVMPSRIAARRFANNGRIASAVAFSRIAHGLDYCGLFARKSFAVFPDLIGGSGGSSGLTSQGNVRFRTGENVTLLRIFVGMTPRLIGTAPDPYFYFSLYDVAGASTTTSDEIHYAVGTWASWTPSEVFHTYVDMTVEPNKEYELTGLRQEDARALYWVAVEMTRSSAVDDTLDGVVSVAPYSNEAPINAADIQRLVEQGTKLHKHNGAHVLSYSVASNSAGPVNRTTTSASYVDITETAFSAPLEFYLPTEYHDTPMRGIPCVFAVNAITSAGSTNGIRLIDLDTGSMVAEYTGITTVEPHWRTVAFTLASSVRYVKAQFKSDGAATLSLGGFAVWSFET